VPDRKSIVQVKFRLRKDILRQLERSAKAYDRSVNAEIAHRLEQSFEHGDIITAVRETMASSGYAAGAAAGDAAGDAAALRSAPARESFKADAQRLGLFKDKDDAHIAAVFKRALRELGIDPDKPEGEDKS
jgi:hypothetical protein